MNTVPMSYRLHIAIFGRRNVGKSTLINALTNQPIAIVSDIPGTTTDPVFKTMEILPVGPVVIIDTAGLDDSGELGNLRKAKTYQVMEKTNLALIVISASEGLTPFETDLAVELKKRKIPTIGVINKSDLRPAPEEQVRDFQKRLGIPIAKVSAITREGIEKLKVFIAENAVYDESQLNIVKDLIHPGDTVVLITHIDCAAPKGRIILPQQQVIRDIIEARATAVVTQENAFVPTLHNLKEPPALIITDSLVSAVVSAVTPPQLKLTSFSILIGRQKGELEAFADGLLRIRDLVAGSRILIVETCTHHRQPNDLGKAQIPNYLEGLTGKKMVFEWASGTHFPDDIKGYDGIIHCGGCMINRQEMQSRIRRARQDNVPITNYGMLITCSQGILSRFLEPFPAISAILKRGTAC